MLLITKTHTHKPVMHESTVRPWSPSMQRLGVKTKIINVSVVNSLPAVR
jgi:hypothetical protein